MKRFLLILALMLVFFSMAKSETVYVLCQPSSFVNVRQFPVKGAEVAGRVELGEALETDGVKKNGYVHVCGFEGGGWINAGFVTEYPVTIINIRTQILSSGRVACRRSINGTRRKWLSDGQNVTVYAFSDDWSITSQGFIKTQYLGGF